MTPADRRRLEHILDAVGRATRYAHDRGDLEREETLDAVLYCLTVVGEALGALSPEAYAALPSVPRRRAAGQRNILVHEYWRADPGIVWETVRRSLPRLRGEVDALLRETGR